MVDYTIHSSADGHSMGSQIPRDGLLSVSASEKMAPGDPVVVTFTDGGAWARWANAMTATPDGTCKLYLAMTDDTVLLGQIFPPVVAVVPRDEIRSMHRVVGAGGGTRESGDDDKALGLLRQFFRGDAIAPIGPEWRPAIRDKD